MAFVFRSIGVLLAAVLLFAGCGSSNDGSSGPPGRGGGPGSNNTPSVEAVKAQYGSLPLEERMSGTVRARNQVAIYPEVNAPVVSVEAQTGEYVQEGAPLVRLKDDVFRERVRQAEASLRIAKADVKSARANLEGLRARLKRTKRLAEQDFQSKQELETLQSDVEGAEAALERAKAQVAQAQATLDERQVDLRRTVVRAPISGYVGARNVEVGQRVDNSTRLYTMGDLDTVKVRVQVTDKMFGKVQEGQSARIFVPSKDTTLGASVTRMSPFLSNESYSAEAEIVVPNTDRVLTPGMFVEVDVAYGESRQATIIPLSAIYEDPTTGARGVFVAPTLGTEISVEMPDSYSAEDPPPLTQPTPTTFRQIEVIAEGQQTAGVRGIQPGDWIVTVGQNLLSAAGEERVDARVRPMSWSRLMALQRMQDTDLLYRILERQQRIAKQRFGSTDSAATDSAQSAAAASGRADSLDSSTLSTASDGSR
ncbi:efflux transporter periplasmic adaptor subunit [Salinibacter sp. 10B]|uniref:efflux RND transporter periplasmic adaptor subunit n=1 Tax=Salinibacter sp. 10B TaxID=1923971 RepID=UPI000CF52BED|nr:efflux RND transporter periplasmic adaptor subunit [Salinibacter sp. 10B]PQJ33840.1 efflux transporter periplasmic adaptor subunit [Salinibacter sp. 10B]